ncbi:MAG: enoyl-CoA hydratase/isomerase family protein [Burkholderiaceae bacterium]|nr:enoyl-CoA hydratase/isomerase family protein [Burkholderiaceae bacterium]
MNPHAAQTETPASGARHLSLDEFTAQARSPYGREEWSASNGVALLVVAVDAASASRHLAQPGESLQALCPVVAHLREPVAAAGLGRFDAVLQDAASLSRVVATVTRAPMAASVLVQLLRAAEGIPARHALTLESMAFATVQGGGEYKRLLADWQRDAGTVAASSRSRDLAVQVERHGDHLDLILNRPQQRNAICSAMRDALSEALDLALADDAIRTIGLSGAGSCFSIGGDRLEFGRAQDPLFAHQVRTLRSPAWRVLECGPRLSVRVHSACIGAGIELAAFAHHIEAEPGAFFQLPELSFGLIPGAGGTVSLPRRIGRQRTAWLALTGRRLNAATALSWGLVDSVRKSGAGG